MTSRAALVGALAALVASGATSRTSFAEGDEAAGRRLWKRGQELYAQQKYLDAARTFEAGYQATPRPLFLLNIGHAYRRAGELARARTAYQQFLQWDPKFEKRAEVEAFIKAIDDALQAAEATGGTTPGTSGPEDLGRSPSAIAAALVDPSFSPAPETTSGSGWTPPDLGARPPSENPPLAEVSRPAPPPADGTPGSDPSPSMFKKPWFWAVVAAVVVGGVGATLLLTQGAPQKCPADLCLKE